MRAAAAGLIVRAVSFSAYLTTFPFGGIAGEACIEVITGVPADHADAKDRFARLWASMSGLRGVGCFWLQAPWGAPNLDAGLLAMTEDVQHIRRIVPFADARPTTLSLTQIVDVTSLLDGQADPGQLRQSLSLRLQVPRAEEIVVRSCHTANLTSTHLDALAEHFEPAGVVPVGYLHVPPDSLQAALVAVAKANTLWRVVPQTGERPRIALLVET